jgi:iron complex transport system ATP-binding protein
MDPRGSAGPLDGHAAATVSPNSMLIECRSLDVCIGASTLLRGLDLALPAGSVLAILGPNGAGKTLSLQTLAGLRPPAAGEVLVRGRDIRRWPKRALARELALLPQNLEDPFPATVLQTVLLGRHPHIARWGWESAQDYHLARMALAAVGLAGYEARDVFTLSGGERRRAAIAAVLAQDPRVYLLDEPTNHLDPSHRIEALQLLRARANGGAAVIVTLHDPNLAARFADQALLIGEHGDWSFGQASQTLTASSLSQLYATQFQCVEQDGRRIFFQP